MIKILGNLSPIDKNTTFNSYEELIEGKDMYERNNNCKWSVQRSKSVGDSNVNLKGGEYYKNRVRRQVRFEYVHYICEISRRMESKANRRNTTSKKTGCDAYFKVKLDNNKLLVYETQFDHSKTCDGRYSKELLTPAVISDANFLLNNGTSPKHVAKFLIQASGEFYNAKDVFNIFLKEQKRIPIDEAIDLLKETGTVNIIQNKEKKIMGITYQTKAMAENYLRYGNVGGLDSTFKLTNICWTFFVLVGLDRNLKLIPFYSFILHNESTKMISKAFEIFVQNNDMRKTTYIITDKDLAERKSLKRFFKKATLNLCRFHIIKSCRNKIRSTSCLNSEEKQRNIKIIKKLCYLEDIEKYMELVSSFAPEIRSYFNKNWEHLKKEFIPAYKDVTMDFNTHTSNNAESYFNNIKQNLKLMQSLGNFLTDIGYFLNIKNLEMKKKIRNETEEFQISLYQKI